MSLERYTEKSYWDNLYTDQEKTPLEVEGFRFKTNADLYRAFQKIDLDNKNILEIGAGDSQWVTFLAKHHPSSSITGLDYSESGCIELKRRAEQDDVDIDIICADMFSPPEELIGKFDIVYSMGVVEHFDKLSEVVEALSQFLKPDGILFSEIPNLSGIYGPIVRWLDLDIYNLHNPHDAPSLVAGHKSAGMDIIDSGYIATTEFAVVSSCINESTHWFKRILMINLMRLSKLISLFEYKLFELPKSKLFSPLIFCAATKSKNRES